jgi:hypothetical protein
LQIDPFSFASEIAWRSVEMKRNLVSLDDIFCDPDAAAEFDSIAARYAPDYTPFEYRWAALWIRKRARKFRKLALNSDSDDAGLRLPRLRRWSQLDFNTFSGQPGVYVVRTESEKLYVGATFDVKKRLELTQKLMPFEDAIGVSIQPVSLPSNRKLHVLHDKQSTFIRMLRPPLNSSCWHSREEADSPGVRVNP